MRGAAVAQKAAANQKSLRFGSLFTGPYLFEDEFQACERVFTCDKAFKKRSDPTLIPMYQRQPWKRTPTLDFLLVRQPKDPALRDKWIIDFCSVKKTPIVILFHHPSELVGSDKMGSTTKKLTALGYTSRTWLLKSELCGSASWDSKFVTFATLESHRDKLCSLPADLHLPLGMRDCGNIVIKHYVPDVTEERFFMGSSSEIVPGSHPVFHNFRGMLKDRPVYSCDGPFPNNPRALLIVPDRKPNQRDIRPLSHPEWCKIKVGKVRSIKDISFHQVVATLDSSLMGTVAMHLSTLLDTDSVAPPFPLPSGPAVVIPDIPVSIFPKPVEPKNVELPSWDWKPKPSLVLRVYKKCSTR